MDTGQARAEPTFDDLRSRLSGALLRPGDPDYDAARAIWNGLIDRRPEAIARCTSPADVVAAVNFARDNALRLAVRSGGHDYAGNSVCEGGLVIDLSRMNEVRIDAEERRARVQPGATMGALDRAAQERGLATTGGTVSTVGLGGYTLGGGSGHLSRKLGLALDNLLSVDVVTAAGERVRASENENPDLFWALRGGGGNFGVATSFEFRLHEVGPEVLAGQIIHPFEDARQVLQFFRTFMADAPDDLQCAPFILKLPPLPVIPEEYHGKTAVNLVVAHVGSAADAEESLRPLREFGTPILDGVHRQPYTQVQQTFDEGMVKGNRWYSKAHYLASLPDEAIDTVLNHSENIPGEFSVVYFEPMGGAINRIDSAATAFPHREAEHGLHIFPGWTDPAMDDEIMRWAREFHEAMAPFATGGVYVNLLPPYAAADEVRSAYGDNYERLAAIKSEYDPGNLFRSNHNIEPIH